MPLLQTTHTMGSHWPGFALYAPTGWCWSHSCLENHSRAHGILAVTSDGPVNHVKVAKFFR